MKIIKCDRCGKEFPAIHYYNDRQFELSKNDGRMSDNGIDLCLSCEGELIQWLTNSNCMKQACDDGIKRGNQNDREDS